MGWIERKEVLGIWGRRKKRDDEMGLFELDEEEDEDERRGIREKERV